MEITGIAAISLAGLTILATLALTWLSFMTSRDFQSVRERVSTLEDRVLETEGAEKRFQFQAIRLLEICDLSHRTNLLIYHYNNILKDVHKDPAQLEIVRDIFLTELNLRIDEAKKLADEAKVVVHFGQEELDSMVAKRPSPSTLLYLQALRDVWPEDMKDGLEDSIRELSTRLYGIDSTRWTGRVRKPVSRRVLRK